jgi:hypothetical protein
MWSSRKWGSANQNYFASTCSDPWQGRRLVVVPFARDGDVISVYSGLHATVRSLARPRLFPVLSAFENNVALLARQLM